MLVIHPFSFRHYFSSPVILNASSPALSFKYHPFILNHSNVRVVPSAVAHIQIVNSESFIHYSVFTVICHPPTVGFVLKHIAFPSLSIVIQIQHHIVFNSTHLLSIHSQQSVGCDIHFNHSIQRQLNHNRRGYLNQSLIPAQSILLMQCNKRILHIFLQYPFIILLALQDLHQRNQHFIPFSFTLLHK